MRFVIITEARQDEHQNQTTATNINYIQKFINIFLKKTNNKVKITPDKTKIEQNNLYFTRKYMGPVYIMLAYNWQKRTITAKLKNSFYKQLISK